MSDDVPAYRIPSADAGHEAIRAPLAEAIDRLDEQIERIDNAFELLLATAGFAQGTLSTVLTGQGAIGQSQDALKGMSAAAAGHKRLLAEHKRRIGELEERIAALESALPTPTSSEE